MKHITIDTLISLGSLLLGAGTTFVGLVLWHSNSEKKKYAAERDFSHLKRNQEQIQNSITYLLRELEKRFDNVERDVVQIRTILNLKRQYDDED